MFQTGKPNPIIIYDVPRSSLTFFHSRYITKIVRRTMENVKIVTVQCSKINNNFEGKNINYNIFNPC